MVVKNKPSGLVLSLAVVTALEAIQADIVRLERKKEIIMLEAGLVPGNKYSIDPDGTANIVNSKI